MIFLGLGTAFAVGALGYELGALLEMGPGYVPLALGLALAALGLATVVKAYVAPDPAPGEVPPSDTLPSETPSSGIPSSGTSPSGISPDDAPPDPRPLAGLQWRPTAAVFGAIAFFALTIDGLGLLPATFGTGLLAALARPGTRPLRALAVAAGLTAASWVIFVVLLQLRLPLLGDWLGG
ncbi:tripartite tricarboxylate transporter TctB family protein [Promicromonospora sukumoe]